MSTDQIHERSRVAVTGAGFDVCRSRPILKRQATATAMFVCIGTTTSFP